MTNIFDKAKEAYGKAINIGEMVKAIRGKSPELKMGEQIHKGFEEGLKQDSRYNEPKGAPKTSEKMVDETIQSTEIYRRAKMQIMNAQRKQVAYGLDKYPEPLNADTWSTVETIDHIIDESIDKLHYLNMLRIKLEQAHSMEVDNMRLEAELDRLADFILQEFPYEIGMGNMREGESAVDVAVRLLGDHRNHQKSLKEMNDLYKKHLLASYDNKVFVDGRLLTPQGMVDLAKSGADLDGDMVHMDSLSEYCKADIEATHKFISGMTSDEEYTHEYTNYINDKPKFTIVTQPDHETGTQEVSINLTLKHDDNFDALRYTLNNELQKMKERGLVK